MYRLDCKVTRNFKTIKTDIDSLNLAKSHDQAFNFLISSWSRNKQHHATKMFKPFKPPLLKQVEKSAPVDLTVSDSECEEVPRPYKKRKLLVHNVEERVTKTVAPSSQAASAPRKPLLVVKSLIESKESTSSASDGGFDGYYLVLWFVRPRIL